jgi:hypothetical protein
MFIVIEITHPVFVAVVIPIRSSMPVFFFLHLRFSIALRPDRRQCLPKLAFTNETWP